MLKKLDKAILDQFFNNVTLYKHGRACNIKTACIDTISNC